MTPTPHSRHELVAPWFYEPLPLHHCAYLIYWRSVRWSPNPTINAWNSVFVISTVYEYQRRWQWGTVLNSDTITPSQCDCSPCCQQRQCFRRFHYLAFMYSSLPLFSIHFLRNFYNLQHSPLSNPKNSLYSITTSKRPTIDRVRIRCVPLLSSSPSASPWLQPPALLRCRSWRQACVHPLRL